MMLTKMLLGAGATSAALAGFVATRPSHFHVERSIDIAVPRERAKAQIDDLHAWTAWSPYEKKDPRMERTYSGPSSGVGASYAWRGNREVGAGRMTIQRTTPSETRIRLDFLEPFAGTCTATYTFLPTVGGTRVTWAMDGKSGFVSKAMHLVFDVDALVGADFEQGLKSLKTTAENDATARVERAAARTDPR